MMLVTNATERMMRMVILGFSLPRSYRGLLQLQQDDRGVAISQLLR